jgi:phospholipase C
MRRSILGLSVLLCAACIDRDYVRPHEQEQALLREKCAFRAGASAADTLGREVPLGDRIPVDTVVYMIQENRSFDSYFSELPAAGVTDVDVPPALASNPDAAGQPVVRYHESRYCIPDLPHDWDPVHQQYGDGRNDGFVVTGGPDSMGYFDEHDLPFYYALAKSFTIGDRFFSSLLGPTLPNRLFALAGSSFGLTGGILAPAYAPNILEVLAAAGVPWKVYFSDVPSAAYFVTTAQKFPDRFYKLSQFFADAAAGALPPFVFLEGAYLGGGGDHTDEHPPGDMQLGQALVARVVRALTTSPQWRRLAFFLTYDEHGGYYDHVPPPPACPPGGMVTKSGETQPSAAFDRLGFRVPFFVISPYAKRGHVTHQELSHASILRFLEARFDLPALSDRTANAAFPFDAFDFQNPPNFVPPDMPAADVDAAQLASCMAKFPTGDETGP